MILANPITGAGGSCCYENKFIPYKPLEYFLKSFVAPRANHPHNEFLYILASGGILGGLPLLFLLLFPVFFLYKKYWKQRPDSWELLLFAMYLYLLIHGQVDCFFPKYPMQLFVWMLCGCAWSNVFRLNAKNALLPRLPEDGKGEK
jgi:O-antigen ligase